ncbi:alpha/beta fold hydrolase [Streptomyces sp. NBC_01102]|uniref:alpha/beta fold hydrolase n=1 Tax=unclassified Streptomyces TaxID=2593676 RepID=UPI00386DCE13|nr:alpha/beta fold hydrolase [Streptomyces sp. NBC_01102]
MSDPQDGAITPVTSEQVTRIAERGIYASPTSLDPAAVNVAQALLATLSGTADGPLLTPDLQQLTEQVQQAATIGFPRIVDFDGVRLSAHTIKLNGSESRPLVIVPSAWTPLGWPLFEYTYLRLAARGYHVLAYTPRGIGATASMQGGGYIDGPFTSGGTIDVAGPMDWSDGSTVIDYAEQHFNPSRIAFLGESYGSAISQLVAAHDPGDRVNAVVALNAWGDLSAGAGLGNDEHSAAVSALIGLAGGPAERKFDEDTQLLIADLQTGRNLEVVTEWATERTPSSYIESTNTRGIPTFLSNRNEALFLAAQITKYFSDLTVPKRLRLRSGDHPAPEATGLTVPFSGSNPPVDEAFDWLDHHLLGTKNDVPNWSETSK